MWFTLLVGTALSSRGFGELKRMNPFLTDEDIVRTGDLVSSLMLTINRSSIVARCRVAAGALSDRSELRRAQDDHARPDAAYSLRGGSLSEHRRVLGEPNRDVHDPRTGLHARLSLLRDHDRSTGWGRSG